MFNNSTLSNLSHYQTHRTCDDNLGNSSTIGNHISGQNALQDHSIIINQAHAHQQLSLNQQAHQVGSARFAGQSLFSINVNHGQPTSGLHNSQHLSTTHLHAQHHPLAQVQHSSQTVPHLLDTTNQHLVPMFSQNASVLQGGNLTDSLTDANQFMVMQQQQQTPHLSQDIGAFNTAAFLSSTSLTQNHSNQTPITTSALHHHHHSHHQHQTTSHQLHQQLQPHQLSSVNVITTNPSNNNSSSANNLDSMNLTNAAGHVIIDQTCSGLLKLHNGSGSVHSAAIVASNFNDLCQNRGLNSIITSSNNCINGDANNNDSSRMNIKKKDINRSNITFDTSNISSTKPGTIGYRSHDINVNNLLNNVANQVMPATTFCTTTSTTTSTTNNIDTINNNSNINININNNITSGSNCSNNNGRNSNIKSKSNTSKTSSNVRRDKQAASQKGSNSPRRTFTCPTCAKGFTEKFNMKRHMQIHSQSRPKYVCNECSKSFAWKDNFIRHKKASHSR